MEKGSRVQGIIDKIMSGEKELTLKEIQYLKGYFKMVRKFTNNKSEWESNEKIKAALNG